MSDYEGGVVAEYKKWLELPENEKYKEWDKDLRESGFSTHVKDAFDLDFNGDDMPEDHFLKNIKYVYQGSIAVVGDHAYDVFMLTAVLSEENVAIYYKSSYIDIDYVTSGISYRSSEEECDSIIEANLERLRRFLVKMRETVPQSGNIEVEYDGADVYFCYFTDDLYGDWFLTYFTKLAVFIDVQTNRRFPFADIREYEQIYRSRVNRKFFLRLSESSEGCEWGIKTLVGCRLSQKLNDVRSRVDELIGEYSIDPAENEPIIKLLNGMRNALSGYTEEKFEDIRDDVFDL